MRLIQKYLPFPRHTEVHRIFVKAKPKEAWETIDAKITTETFEKYLRERCANENK
jgi:hypothetical protein